MGRRRVKANMDIELAVDILEMVEHLDHIILFSGDGDFRNLVAAVQRKGLRVSVVSTLKSSPAMVADELRRQADDFIELSELAPLLARSPRENGARMSVAEAAPASTGTSRTTERAMRAA